MRCPLRIGEKPFADAVERADAFRQDAETEFFDFEVVDGIVLVVFLGLDHPVPLPRVVSDGVGIAKLALAGFRFACGRENQKRWRDRVRFTAGGCEGSGIRRRSRRKMGVLGAGPGRNGPGRWLPPAAHTRSARLVMASKPA